MVQSSHPRLPFDVAIVAYVLSLLVRVVCLLILFVGFLRSLHKMKERLLRGCLHRYVYTELILQMAGLPPLRRDEFEDLLLEHPETTMMHGRKLLAGVDSVERGTVERED